MKKHVTKSLAFLFCISTCFGCATQTFMMRENPPGHPYKHTDKMQHFFVQGVGQEKMLNAAKMCGGVDRIYKVQTKYTFVNWLLAAVTLGIYTPHQAKVYCIPVPESKA
ncbi:MAG: Bor family protein [Myxococcota bacterium]